MKEQQSLDSADVDCEISSTSQFSVGHGHCSNGRGSSDGKTVNAGNQTASDSDLHSDFNISPVDQRDHNYYKCCSEKETVERNSDSNCMKKDSPVVTKVDSYAAPSVTVNCKSVDEWKAALSSKTFGMFSFISSSTLPTFVTLSNDINPKAVISVVINADFTAKVTVFGKSVKTDHSLWEKVPSRFDTTDRVCLLLNFIFAYAVCSGVTESHLVRLIDQSRKSVYRDSNNVVRSVDCCLLTNAGRICTPCLRLKGNLRRILFRRAAKSLSDDLIRDRSKKKVLSSQ